MSPMPTFGEFYAALHGREPFPWQSRLAQAALSVWPAEVGVPTGLGKTSCLDIAVWCLAKQATCPARERSAPTRIWWLVNRRLLVDATTAHAERLAELLSTPDLCETPGGPVALAQVADRLRSLAPPGSVPLEVIRLRGGAALGRPSSPAQPAIILSTIPMYGSRLLFRGYGVSRSMRPVDAALAGTDSLVLADEAHLAHHLMSLFEPLRQADRATAELLPPGRNSPQVVSLTATGREASTRFDLDAVDMAHPVIRQRLDGAKPCTIDSVDEKQVAQRCAQLAAEIAGSAKEPTSLVIFANTPASARSIHREVIRKVKAASEIVLLTGRMREREAGAVRALVLDPALGAPAGRRESRRERHLIVIATQTLEVGADLDFEHLITEPCGVRALTQRMGRLNRLGLHDSTSATYLASRPKPEGGEWPVYGTEPDVVEQRLRQHAQDGVVDLGVGRIREVLGEPGDDPGYAPQILPALLWEWVKTTNPPEGEAPVEPYFSGLRRPDRDVSICWRSYIPAAGERLWPGVRDDECVDIPLHEARTSLGDGSVMVVGPDRGSLIERPIAHLRPGDVIVASAEQAQADEFGWNPNANGSVVDMALLRSGLPLDAGAFDVILGAGPWALAINTLLDPSDDLDSEQLTSDLIAELRAATPTVIPRDEWQQFVDGLSREIVAPVNTVAHLRCASDTPEPLIDDFDELSLAAPIGLAEHGRDVGGLAADIATRMGMVEAAVVTLRRAGSFHDLGKYDERFQLWLDPRSIAAEPVAKSSRPQHRWTADRIASGWPQGGRHEALSARLASAWLAGVETDIATASPLNDLVVHLVLTHHGHGRPFLMPVEVDQIDDDLVVDIEGTRISVPRSLSEADWGQPARFRRLNTHFGYWGLALLEATLRLADHRMSAIGSGGGVA